MSLTMKLSCVSHEEENASKEQKKGWCKRFKETIVKRIDDKTYRGVGWFES